MKVATLFRFGFAAALLIAATGVGFADVKHVFVAGEVVSAATINDNFADLDKRISSPTRVATAGAVSYSIGATRSCGATAATTGKFDPAAGGGYVAAKKACEAKCGTATAHMCSSEEVVRLAQMGTPATAGWIATGAVATTPGPTAVSNDCYGYATDVGTTAAPPNTQQFGALWTGGFVAFSGCNTQNPISCCD